MNTLIMTNPILTYPVVMQPVAADPTAKLADITYEGDSGQRYSFAVYPINTTFNSVGGVYLITKRTESTDGTATHAVIYIGQTNDLCDRFTDYHRLPGFARNYANCICVLQEENEETRLDVETDLIRGHRTPCNG